MEAKELRIGNWVNLYDDFNSEVTGLTNTKKVWCVNNPTNEGCAWYADKINPIPLTEEWLLKFGFEEEEEQDELLDTLMFSKDNITRVEFSNKHRQLYWHDNYSSIYHIELIYVHQLQNLYFFLTGEELTIDNGSKEA